MTVRAQESEVVAPVVPVFSVDVIHVGTEHAVIPPAILTTRFTLECSTDVQERSSEQGGLLPTVRIRAQNEDLLRAASTLRSGSSRMSLAGEVAGVQAKALDAPADVGVAASRGSYDQLAHHPRDADRSGDSLTHLGVGVARSAWHVLKLVPRTDTLVSRDGGRTPRTLQPRSRRLIR